MTRSFSTLDALRAAIGEDLGVSDWLTIDQSRIDAYTEATGDRHYGYLTLSLLPALVASIVSYDGWRARLNYGSNQVRYPALVTCGSRVRAQVTLMAVNPTPIGLQVETRVTLEHEYGSQLQPIPALVANVLTLLLD